MRNIQITDSFLLINHLIIVKHFKDTILNKLVHNTERSAFPNEIKGAINSIVELERLLPRTPVQPINSTIREPNN